MDVHIIGHLPSTSGLFLYIPHADYWTRQYLPCSLKGVKVKASIVDMVSRVTLSQTFSNDNAASAYEALYRFPLYENSAVCEFHMEHSGRKILGIVKSTEEAVKTYETAKAQGKTAALVLQKEPDIFQMKVGNIPPKATITVTLTYITPLKQDTESAAVRFTLPTAIAPRYGDGSDTGVSNVNSANAGFEFTLDARMPSQITSVSSPSHPVMMALTGTTSAQITLSNPSPALDKDVVVLVAAKDVDEPRCVIETTPSSKCAMLTLVPKFNLPRTSTEVIFIVDCSGSMYDKVNTVRRALQLFLKSLPASPEIYFNICCFGSTFDFMFSNGSKKYDEKTLQTAEKYVAKIGSEYGGTEVLDPLLACMRNRRTDRQTTIILLTDGEVYNTTAITNSIVEERAKHTKFPLRLFSLGIGDAVSHHLVEGIARAGAGYSQFVTSQERLDKKVVRMLSAGLQAPLDDFQLDWPGKPSPNEMVYNLVGLDHKDEFEVVEKPQKTSTSFFDKDADDSEEMKAEPPPKPAKFSLIAPPIQQFPETIPPLYNASRHVMFLLFPTSHPVPQTVALKATLDGSPVTLDIPVTEVRLDDEKPIIHTLAARTLLGELQEGRLDVQTRNANNDSLADAVVQEGIRIGVKYSLASKWTSFVAVDEQSQSAHDQDATETPAMEPAKPRPGIALSALQMQPQALLASITGASSGRAQPKFKKSTSTGFAKQKCDSESEEEMAVEMAESDVVFPSPTSYGVMHAAAAPPPPPPQPAAPFLGVKRFVGGVFQAARKSSRKEESEKSYSASCIPSTMSPVPTGAPPGALADMAAADDKEATTDEGKLHEIVIQQESSGAFPANTKLARRLGFDNTGVVAAKLPPALNNKVSQAIWMTVLICVFLENKLKSEKEAWELVVEKAWNYVSSQVGAGTVDDLKKAAIEALGV